jgi:hypothetical protein
MIVRTFHERASLHSTSHNCSSLHFTPLIFTLMHFWTFRHHPSKTLHFSSLVITFLTLFLKICDLLGKVAISSTGVLSCTKCMNICCRGCGSVCVRNVLCCKVTLHYNDMICTQSAVRRSKETGVIRRLLVVCVTHGGDKPDAVE